MWVRVNPRIEKTLQSYQGCWNPPGPIANICTPRVRTKWMWMDVSWRTVFGGGWTGMVGSATTHSGGDTNPTIPPCWFVGQEGGLNPATNYIFPGYIIRAENFVIFSHNEHPCAVIESQTEHHHAKCQLDIGPWIKLRLPDSRKCWTFNVTHSNN